MHSRGAIHFDHFHCVAAYVVADVTAYLTGCLLDGLLARSPNALDRDNDVRLNDCTGNRLSKPLLQRLVVQHGMAICLRC